MKISLICEKGGREFNQDYADYAVMNGYICVAVADGLGSYDGSEASSETAVKSVLRSFRKAVKKEENIFDGQTIAKFFRSAHSSILKMKSVNPELKRGCTTLSVAIAFEGRLICAHVGDTRIYFFKNNRLEFYSRDHSLARYAADRGEISYPQIRQHPDQNKLTKVVGSDHYSAPDFKIYNGYTDEDSVLICTDGFWEYIYEEDMEAGLSVTDSSSLVLNALHRIHSERADEYCDNYSAILLRFSNEKIADNGDAKVIVDDKRSSSHQGTAKKSQIDSLDDDNTSSDNSSDKSTKNATDDNTNSDDVSKTNKKGSSNKKKSPKNIIVENNSSSDGDELNG